MGPSVVTRRSVRERTRDSKRAETHEDPTREPHARTPRENPEAETPPLARMIASRLINICGLDARSNATAEIARLQLRAPIREDDREIARGDSAA